MTEPPEDVTSLRRRRHGDEVTSLLETGQLDRAADLAMEHLSEFPDDVAVRAAVAAALLASGDARRRRRAIHLGRQCD